jgi:hypothetical protein
VPVRNFLELFPEDGAAMRENYRRGLGMRVFDTVDRVDTRVQWPGRKAKLSPTGNHPLPLNYRTDYSKLQQNTVERSYSSRDQPKSRIMEKPYGRRSYFLRNSGRPTLGTTGGPLDNGDSAGT